MFPYFNLFGMEFSMTSLWIIVFLICYLLIAHSFCKKWHQDFYKYVSSENRIKLLNLLKNNGFYIHLVKERCERYAVIDDEIIWYGNINLLSNKHEEESIMRVVSKEIASEILEMTFGNKDTKAEIIQKTLF